MCKSPQELPYNITSIAEKYWGLFLTKTKQRDPAAAFDAYHKYGLAKEEAFKRRQPLQDKGLEM